MLQPWPAPPGAPQEVTASKYPLLWGPDPLVTRSSHGVTFLAEPGFGSTSSFCVLGLLTAGRCRDRVLLHGHRHVAPWLGPEQEEVDGDLLGWGTRMHLWDMWEQGWADQAWGHHVLGLRMSASAGSHHQTPPGTTQGSVAALCHGGTSRLSLLAPSQARHHGTEQAELGASVERVHRSGAAVADWVLWGSACSRSQTTLFMFSSYRDVWGRVGGSFTLLTPFVDLLPLLGMGQQGNAVRPEKQLIIGAGEQDKEQLMALVCKKPQVTSEHLPLLPAVQQPPMPLPRGCGTRAPLPG